LQRRVVHERDAAGLASVPLEQLRYAGGDLQRRDGHERIDASPNSARPHVTSAQVPPPNLAQLDANIVKSLEQCEGGDLNPARSAQTSTKPAPSDTKGHRPSCQVVHPSARTCVSRDDCGTIREPLAPTRKPTRRTRKPTRRVASCCPKVRSPGSWRLRSLGRSRPRRTQAVGTS
jgi:hypothetical protein